MKNKLFLFLFIFIIIIAFILRFYKLGEVPNGLYQDETSIGYNAYSIIMSGKDEYGTPYPVYFKSFGDWKLPVYIYSDIIPVKLFGLTAFAVRFPSALFGFLTVIIFYFFVSNLTKNKKLAIISTALLSINPWALHYNRATFEVSMGLFFFLLGGFLLNKFFRKNIKFTFLLGIICFIIALYSYNLTRLLSPLLFGLFILYNKKYLKKSYKPEIIYSVLIGIILLLPFLITLNSGGGASSASGTLIFSSAAVQAPLLEFRSYVAGLPFNTDALFFNKYVMTAWQYITNVISYFSVQFLFVSGSQHGNHGIGNVGLFYLFEFPLFIVGIITLIKRKITGRYLIFIWISIVIFIASLTRDVPHATRSFFTVAPLEVISGAGMLAVYEWIKKIRSGFLKIGVALIGFILIIYNLIFYFSSYYIRFPVLYAKQWNLNDKLLTDYLKKNEKKYKNIIFDKDAGFKYSSLLFYLSFPPEEFQKTVKRKPDDSEGFSEVMSFGKYEFRKINWDKDIHLPNTLIVSEPDDIPELTPIIHKISYPRRPVVIAVQQEIQQYPVDEGAYVVVETK